MRGATAIPHGRGVRAGRSRRVATEVKLTDCPRRRMARKRGRYRPCRTSPGCLEFHQHGMAAIDRRQGRCGNLPINPRFSLSPDKRQKLIRSFANFAPVTSFSVKKLTKMSDGDENEDYRSRFRGVMSAASRALAQARTRRGRIARRVRCQSLSSERRHLVRSVHGPTRSVLLVLCPLANGRQLGTNGANDGNRPVRLQDQSKC